jgi:NADH-quinone oxidoreductase subunit M
MGFAGLTLIFGAVYMLRLFQKSMLGPLNPKFAEVADIKGHELLVLGIVVLLILAIGIYPNALLQLSEASVTQLIQQVNF